MKPGVCSVTTVLTNIFLNTFYFKFALHHNAAVGCLCPCIKIDDHEDIWSLFPYRRVQVLGRRHPLTVSQHRWSVTIYLPGPWGWNNYSILSQKGVSWQIIQKHRRWRGEVLGCLLKILEEAQLSLLIFKTQN
jgi:hypothetical protein